MSEDFLDVLGVFTAFATVMLVFSIAITSLVQATQGLLRWRARNLQNGLAKIMKSVQDEGSQDDAWENAISLLNNSYGALVNTKIPAAGLLSRFFGPQVSWMDPDELDRELRRQKEIGLNDAQATEISEKFRKAQGTMRKLFLRRMRMATILWAFVIAFYYQLSTPDLLRDFSMDPDLRDRIATQGETLAAADTASSAQNGDDDEAGNTPALPGVTATADGTTPYFQLQPWSESWGFYYEKDAPTDAWYAGFQGKNIVGVLMTVLLLSLGAPFWFDMLKSVVSLRDTLSKATGDDEKAGGEATETETRPSPTDERINLLKERMLATKNAVVKATLQKEINDLRLIRAEKP